jgi:hypothetical protein
MYNVFAQSESKNGFAYMMNWTQQVVPYTKLTMAGFQIKLTDATLWSGLPLWVSVKYIGKVRDLDNCNLYASGMANNILQFSNYSANNTISGFTLGNFGDGPNTAIIPNKPGIYEITCSGAVKGKGNSIIGTLNNVNVQMYNVFAQSESKDGLAYMMNWTQQCVAYSNLSAAGFQMGLTAATLWDGMPLWLSVKYISPIDADVYIPQSLSIYYPGNCNLYASGMINGMLQFSNYRANNTIRGFTIGNVGYGANTAIIPNKPGIYEITCSGAVIGKGKSIICTLNNENILQYNVFAQSESKDGLAYMMNWTVQARPYSNLSAAGFQIKLTDATLWDGMPLWISVRYLAL